MKIKRLFIRDFGIFNNQLMDEIGPGLVIVGGHNRAGKTTFLELLRHIAFGFPRKKSFISAREKHEVEAIVSTDNNEEVNIHIQGFGEPVVSVLNSSKQISSTSEIYNNMDSFTYQQLFTISLDELQSNYLNNNEKERLQSILLGAGLKEFILLPQLEDYFYKKAEKIGGKNGDPKVKDFKPYYLQIEEGLKKRSTASKQVEGYNIKKKELKNTKNTINKYKKKKNSLQNELNRLDILKNNYNIYSNIIEIKGKINTVEARNFLDNKLRFYPERAKDIINKYREKKAWIKKQSILIKEKFNLKSIDNIGEKIYRNKEKINSLRVKLSGLKEKINFYNEEETNLIKTENDLKASLDKINEDWNSDLEYLNYIKTDNIQLNLLQEDIDNYKKISLNLERERENLLKYQEREKHLEDTLSTLEIGDPKKRLQFYFWGSLFSTIFGFGLSFINIYLGIFALVGFFGLIIYLLYRYTLEKGHLVYREKSNIELNNLKQKIILSQKKIEEYGIALDPIEKKINKYKSLFGLPSKASPDLIKENFREIQQIKNGEKRFEKEKIKHLRYFNKIEEELRKVLSILNEFPELFSLENVIDDQVELYLQNDIIFSMLKSLFDFMDNIIELYTYQQEIEGLTEEVKELYLSSGLEFNERTNTKLMIYLEDYLEQSRKKEYYINLKEKNEQLTQQLKGILNTELVRKAMGDFNVKEEYKTMEIDQLFENFIYLYNNFLTLSNVGERYKQTKDKLEDLVEDIERKHDKLITIKKELEDLATDEKLKNASVILDQGNNQLSYLAEEYAVNKAAGFILKKVQETFVQETKEKLLSGASKYFKEITGGQYKAILPPEQILEGDFQALLRDGTIQDSTDLLSRGTTEQLFLAIRISRIKDIEPALPVIIDDSFVNFDNFHLIETMSLINDLAKTNQIFLLTCHPHLVELCTEDIPIQYWKLDNGNFQSSNKDDLIRHLRIF